jgi:hypothetical protein
MRSQFTNPHGVHILRGARDLYTGLWQINLQNEQKQHSYGVENNVYELRNTGALLNYLHKAMFSPKKNALLQAVKNGHLVTWPGLTEQTINKHLKMTPATQVPTFYLVVKLKKTVLPFFWLIGA